MGGYPSRKGGKESYKRPQEKSISPYAWKMVILVTSGKNRGMKRREEKRRREKRGKKLPVPAATKEKGTRPFRSGANGHILFIGGKGPDTFPLGREKEGEQSIGNKGHPFLRKERVNPCLGRKKREG